MYVWLSAKIAENIFDIDQQDESEKAEWTRYFIEIILLNVLKTALVLFCGIIFNVLYLTVISQLVFFCLRRHAFGWHAKSNFLCSIQCIVLFVGIPLLTERYVSVFPTILWLLIYSGILLIFILFAPQKTEQSLDSHLTNKQHKRRLLISFLLVAALAILMDITWLRIGIFTGVIASAMMVLPFTKKIIEGDVFNETYQKFVKQKNEPLD